MRNTPPARPFAQESSRYTDPPGTDERMANRFPLFGVSAVNAAPGLTARPPTTSQPSPMALLLRVVDRGYWAGRLAGPLEIGVVADHGDGTVNAVFEGDVRHGVHLCHALGDVLEEIGLECEHLALLGLCPRADTVDAVGRHGRLPVAERNGLDPLPPLVFGGRDLLQPLVGCLCCRLPWGCLDAHN